MKFELIKTPIGPAYRCEPYEIRHYEYSSNGVACMFEPHFRAYVRIGGLFGNHVNPNHPEYKTLDEAIKACVLAHKENKGEK